MFNKSWKNLLEILTPPPPDRPVERTDRRHLVGRQEVRRQQGHGGQGEGEGKMIHCDEKQSLMEVMISTTLFFPP